MSDTPTSIYSGLSQKARLWVLALGAAIAVLNLWAAWYFAHQTGQTLSLRQEDLTPLKEWIAAPGNENLSSEARHDLTVRAMYIVAYTKAIANKQGLILACFGSGFALTAVGFALFVIGADGAFKASATTPDKAKLVFSGTAPGLFCFVMAGWLISQGITQRTEFRLPLLASEIAAQGAAQNGQKSSKSCRYQLGDECFTEEEWKKKFGQ